MESKWYWEQDGVEQGPTETAELESMIGSGQLQDTNRVRIAGSQDWLPVTEVRSLFEGGPAASPDSPAAAAARALSDQRRLHLEPGYSGNSQSDFNTSGWLYFPVRLVKGIFWGCGYVLSEILDRLSSRGTRAHSKGGPTQSTQSIAGNAAATTSNWTWRHSLARHKIAIATIFLMVLVAILLKVVVFADYQNEQAYDQLSAIANQLEQQQGNVPAEVRQKQIAEISETRTQLQANVSGGESWSPSYYWTESGFRRAGARERLIKACEVVERLLSKDATSKAYRRALSDLLKSADLLMAKNRTASDKFVKANFDPTITSIVVLDVLAFGGFLIWWRRRRR